MAEIFSKTLMNSINATLSFRTKSVNRIKNVLTREENGILNAAFLLMIIVLATKFTGLLFNAMAAGYLGAEPYNEFLFASNIPEIISASILFGAISGSIIPVLVQSREEAGHSRFQIVLNTLINVSLITFTLVSIVMVILAPSIFPWLIDNVIKPVDPPSQGEIGRIIDMFRILLITQVILGVSTFISSSLNVMQRFVVPQLAPLFYNFGRIIAIIILIPILGQSPWVLVWGTVIGSLFHLVVQLPLASHLDLRYRPVIHARDKYFLNILRLGLPRVLGLSAEQIAIGVDRTIAYGLVGFSLTAYELAVRLVVIPISLFGMTFSTAVFPLLSRSYIKGEIDVFRQTFVKVLNQIIFLSLPLTVMLLVLRLPITRLFYGILGDSFTWTDTRKVAWVVLFFAFGLTFESLRTLMYRTYYATHNSIVPLVSATLTVALGIVTGILFTNYFSHFDQLSLGKLTFNPDYFFTKSDGFAAVGGLALSSSVIYTLESVGLLIILNIRVLKMSFIELLKPIILKAGIAIVTAIVAYFLYTLYNDILDTSKTLQIMILTGSTLFASGMVYIWLSYLFNVKETEMLDKLARLILRKLRLRA